MANGKDGRGRVLGVMRDIGGGEAGRGNELPGVLSTAQCLGAAFSCQVPPSVSPPQSPGTHHIVVTLGSSTFPSMHASLPSRDFCPSLSQPLL